MKAIFQQKVLLFGILVLLVSFNVGKAQGILSGKVQDPAKNPIYGASILWGTAQRLPIFSDSLGKFSLSLPAGNYIVKVSVPGYNALERNVVVQTGKSKEWIFTLTPDTFKLKEVEVREDFTRTQVSTIQIDPRLSKFVPAPFGEFNRILATLPGVQSPNEMSSAYAVRGGNYDENLVYVNDMEVYRPQLIRAGQQEGLSFVNPELVERVQFSSGGWQARFGDKLSSVMDVRYKTPTQNKGSLTLGILNQQAHWEGISKDKRFTVVAGLRRKASRYLLGSNIFGRGLETQGQYWPLFADGQAWIQFKPKGDSSKTTFGLLLAYGYNQYRLQPTLRQTDFGTLSQSLRLLVAFEGEESLAYETAQTGLRLSHRFSKRLRTELTVSRAQTIEVENTNVEAGYRICDVERRPDRSNFNQCISEEGVATQFRYARNRLNGTIYQTLNRWYFVPNEKNVFEFGWGASQEHFKDRLNEFSFIDSTDYVRTDYRIFANNKITNNRLNAYFQHQQVLGSGFEWVYGARVTTSSFNPEVFFSPRIQISFKPQNSAKNVVYRVAAGVYNQSPFFREFRDSIGNLNANLKAQRSVHLVAGTDFSFQMWGRPFKFLAETYFKTMQRTIPYDVDNVRIRYFARNAANAYAAGADFRVSGEFIRGAESWFSLGLLKTAEDIEGDNRGYLRRPTDQRVTLSAFFQDHLLNDPTNRIYLNMVFGTGLPFSPPGIPQLRSNLRGEVYRRVDIGFSKVVSLSDKGKKSGKLFDTIWLGIEVLNLLGAENTISYEWITTFSQVQLAVPNSLSARFFNLRAIVNFQ